MQASHKVRQDLIDAGLVEHTDKCNWVPVQQVTWLGFNLDLEKGQIYMPTEKVQRLKSQLEQVLDRPTLKARELRSKYYWEINFYVPGSRPHCTSYDKKHVCCSKQSTLLVPVLACYLRGQTRDPVLVGQH